LFILFVIAIEFNQRDRLNFWEISFMVYALGFTLEKIAAMQEHGIKGQSFGLDPIMRVTHHSILVYFKGTWVGIILEHVRAVH
jgi:hypothetical protein